jgi:hypothetical protein
MKILEGDIDSVEPFGMMDGKPVNLVKTKGGLCLATAMDSKGQDTVLGAASHQAILCYSVEQRFPTFQPMMMKSEGLSKIPADSHSHFLSDDLRKSGYDIYSIQKGNDIEFVVTKMNIQVGRANSSIENDCLMIKSLDVSKEYVTAMSAAVSEKALSSGVKKVRIK